jgi:hypothetical protein
MIVETNCEVHPKTPSYYSLKQMADNSDNTESQAFTLDMKETRTIIYDVTKDFTLTNLGFASKVTQATWGIT